MGAEHGVGTALGAAGGTSGAAGGDAGRLAAAAQGTGVGTALRVLSASCQQLQVPWSCL